MSIRVAMIGILLIFLTDGLPSDGPCDWTCHDRGCVHAQEFLAVAAPQPVVDYLISNYAGVVQALHDMPHATYKQANLYVYGLSLPLLFVLFSLPFWRRDKDWILLFIPLALYFALHPNWYAMCTEFCYKVGNWTKLYYGGAAYLICVVIPALVIAVDIFLLGRLIIKKANDKRRKTALA